MTYLAHWFKVGNFSRDVTVASGTQTITGVGFKPKAVILFSTISLTTGNMSMGVDDSTSGYAVYSDHNVNPDVWVSQLAASMQATTGAGVTYYGSVNSFDDDGFTVGWTKVGLPTGTFVTRYLAIR